MGLAVLVVAIGLARVVLPVLPWRRVSVRLNPVDVVSSILGGLGLVFHCGTMFYRSTILSVRAPKSAIARVRLEVLLARWADGYPPGDTRRSGLGLR